MVEGQPHRRYTIAWICPLAVEYAAAVRMLDKNYGSPSFFSSSSNSYTLGSIHGHNVIVLMLGEAGSVPAADAIARMRLAFPELEHGLLVGIGGGVPVNTDNGDVRLGDVVVSTPASVHPGTVRYDQGKAETDGFTRTGCLSRPPVPFLIASKKLDVIRSPKNDPIYRNLKRFEVHGPAQGQVHPGTSEDRLFDPNYNHIKPGADCIDCGCDTRRLVHRAQRDDEKESPYVVVHRGTIATGEMIIKDAATRDKLAQEFKAICFETEAAGVLYDFPCLVIRGISDYSDSHKDRRWHNYAAATAAAYARALLEHVPYPGAERSTDDDLPEEKQRRLIATWLSPMVYEHQQQYLRSLHMEGTGQWLLNDARFIEWLGGRKKTLMFSGAPGVGKSVMVSSVIRHLQANFSGDPFVAMPYVYCDSRQAEQSPLKLLSNILKQLYAGLDSTPRGISELHQQCVQQRRLPTYGQISRAVTVLSNQYERVFIIVDALDEILHLEKAEKLLATLADLQANSHVNILLTWREIPSVMYPFDNISRIEVQAPMTDLEEYLERRIDQVPFLSNDALARQQVKTNLLRVLEKSPRFLRAHLYMEVFQDCSSTTEVVDILEATTDNPHDYRDIYMSVLARIQNQVGEKRYTSTCVLAWLSYAMRPLTLQELQYAVTMQAKRTGKEIPSIRDSAFIVSACLGFVSVNPANGTVQLVHATAHDHLHRAQTEWGSTAHSEITQTCMEYLSHHDYYSKETADTGGLSPGLFHQYAAQYWGHHAQMSSTSLTNDIVEFIASEELVVEISRHVLALKDDHEHPRVQNTGMTNMHLAAYFGLQDTLEAIVRVRENLPWYQRVMNRIFGGSLGLDSKDSSGRTPLSYVAEKGNLHTVELLLEKGAAADLRDVTGRTPLSWAAGVSNYAGLSGLFRHADIDAEDNSGRTPLSWAAANGHLEAVDWLLGKKKSLNIMTEDRSTGVLQGLVAGFKNRWAKNKSSLNEDRPSGGTPLIWASSNGQLCVVEYLLENNASLEDKDWNGRTALSWAAGNGHAAVLGSLLQQGSDPKATDNKKRDSLMWAAAHGHLTIASYLLRQAACFKPTDESGRTALSLAAGNGQNAVVTLLLEKGASSDSKDNGGRRPLSWAAEGGHINALTALLDHHAASNRKDNNGRTALSWAAGVGQAAAVELLLKTGANLEITDHSGRNALSWAAGNGQTEMVLFLLDIGNPSLQTATDTSGFTFFLWAARNGHHTMISRLLGRLDHDLIHTPTKKGETALFVACQYGRTEVVKTFLREDVFFKHETNNLGLTPIMAATSENQFEIVELLLRYGIPVNAMDRSMQTVLHHAAHRGSLHFVKLFLHHGASLEVQDNSGRSPLLVAVERNHADIANLLLSYGARVDCQAHDGQSPLHWAVKHNNVKMAQMLLRCGANVGITDKQGLTPEALAVRLDQSQGEALRQLLRNNSDQRA